MARADLLLYLLGGIMVGATLLTVAVIWTHDRRHP